MRTIAAVATPTGEGALAVIRISGENALTIVKKLAHFPKFPISHRAYLRRLTFNKEQLDQAIVLFFRAPHSFTGEDVVELQCHGGKIGIKRVLSAVIACGARVAEAGEFSRQALLNNKLDLLQVESIADLIHAKSEAAHQLALTHLDGKLSTHINELKSKLAHLVALIETAIDFSAEEHTYQLERNEIFQRIIPLKKATLALLATYQTARMQQEGIQVAIVGKPNAGKSTLLNYLLQFKRAIVSEIPGTTRDYIKEPVFIKNILFQLIDTAGLRGTKNPLEQLGVSITKTQAAQADLLLVVVDAQKPEDLASITEQFPERPYGVIWNKMDLGNEKLDSFREEKKQPALSCEVSFKTKYGTETLKKMLLQLAHNSGIQTEEDTILISRARHKGLLFDVSQQLERAIIACEQLPYEFIAQDLREALDSFGTLTGAITNNDILHAIFSEFCVGK